MTSLSVRGLTKSFNGHRAVSGVSFDVAPGEIIALIGPNGAGKTTCFNMLNGQLRPDTGQIIVAGHDVAGWPPERICRLGVGRGFQIAATFASMTVRDNARTALLSHHRRIWRFIRPARAELTGQADALLARVGILHLADQGCGTLAYGDLKRLELALAIASRPSLLLMDEPTAGMTATDRQAVMDLVVALAREDGSAILFTEHDTDTVFRTADRILVMDKSELIAEGTAETVRADPRVRTAYLGI